MKRKKSRIKNFARKVAVSALIPIAFFAGARTTHAKDETIKLFSTELSYTKGNDVVKFKPFIHTAPSGTQRTDLMLGRKFGDFTPYFYFKSDNKDRSWMGLRIDYQIKALGDKLTINNQLRYFCGLNDLSANHFYFIPTIDYKLNDKFKVGLLGYAKKEDGKKPFFYVGPSLTVNLTKNLSTLLSYDTDIFRNQDADMIFVSLQYKY